MAANWPQNLVFSSLLQIARAFSGCTCAQLSPFKIAFPYPGPHLLKELSQMVAFSESSALFGYDKHNLSKNMHIIFYYVYFQTCALDKIIDQDY